MPPSIETANPPDLPIPHFFYRNICIIIFDRAKGSVYSALLVFPSLKAGPFKMWLILVGHDTENRMDKPVIIERMPQTSCGSLVT